MMPVGMPALRLCGVLAAVACVLALWGLPAETRPSTPPEGCTTFLTVQTRACSVSLYWQCESLDNDVTWESTFGEDGPEFVSSYNSEFHWLETYYFGSGAREVMGTDSARSPSLSELLETGENAYDFVIYETGPQGPFKTRFTGVDRLTGETVTIDGEELLSTEYAAVATDAATGDVLWSITGQQYVMAEDRLFLSGTDQVREDGQIENADYSPVDILRPGDPGFGETRPLYGCGVLDL